MSERSDSKHRGALVALVLVCLVGAAALQSDAAPPANEPRLEIDIKPKDLEKLQQKRDEALAKGVPLSSNEDVVTAKLRLDGRSVKVRLEPKGDLAKLDAGTSFRVSVRGGRTVLGMRRFSLQAAASTARQREPLFFEYLREEGLLAPRNLFVQLRVNGKDLGRSLLAEHFSTELLESQRRRDAVIIRFDATNLEAGEATFGRVVPDYDNWRNAPFDAFHSSRVAKSPLLSAQRDVGFGLLRGLAEGRLAAAAALDIDAWAGFLAACELWSTPRLAHWNNLRMYLNPFTLLLEPIGDDGGGTPSDAPTFHCIGGDNAMMAALLEDSELRAAFLDRLHESAKKVATRDFANWLGEREPLDRLRARAKLLLNIDASNFAKHVPPATKRAMPKPNGARYPLVVRAGLATGAPANVELASALSQPVEVTALYAERGPERRPIVAGSDAKGTISKTLEATAWPDAPNWLRIPVTLPEAKGGDWQLRGEARVDGQLYRFEVERSVAALSESALPESSVEDALASHAFLSLAPDSSGELRWLSVTPGVHEVEGSLIVPRGHGLRMAPGTTLRFSPKQLLLARGPLDFTGTAEAPIQFESRGGRFNGVVALGSRHPSVWKHVTVRDTEAVDAGAWLLTGGVTFLESELTLERVRFEDSSAEDSLNLVRSEVAIRGIAVARTPSDAVDFDFCTGSVRGGSFSDVGGDGLDAAGSELSFDDVELVSIGDKAVSIGEASKVRVSEFSAKNTSVGVASKDGSLATVERSSFDGVRLAGLMAYTKKDAYGPARLEARDVSISGSGRQAIAQLGSAITIDGATVEPEALDVEALYAAQPKKK